MIDAIKSKTCYPKIIGLKDEKLINIFEREHGTYNVHQTMTIKYLTKKMLYPDTRLSKIGHKQKLTHTSSHVTFSETTHWSVVAQPNC